MGDIVAAMASCHAPQLLTFPAEEDQDQLRSSIDAMQQLGRLLDETSPDVLIVFGSDHLETFPLTCVPTFAIVAGDRVVATFAGRRYDLPVHRELAEAMLEGLVSTDFDVAYSEDAVLGHAFAVPFEYILDGRNIPVVPVHTNVYMPPLPSPARCAALGRRVADIIGGRPERIAVLASGGMSHFPGTWKYPHPEFTFDHWLIHELESGNIGALLNMTATQLDQVGNTELLNWCAMLGMIGDQSATLLQYTSTWHHGHAMVQFLPPVDHPRQAERADTAQYGGFEFRDQGFEFYTHPPAAAYNLNKLLHDVRLEEATRQRLLTDLDGVASQYHLTDEQHQAIRAIPAVGNAAFVSDCAEPLVAAGAHPLQALMCLHAVRDHLSKR